MKVVLIFNYYFGGLGTYILGDKIAERFTLRHVRSDGNDC